MTILAVILVCHEQTSSSPSSDSIPSPRKTATENSCKNEGAFNGRIKSTIIFSWYPGLARTYLIFTYQRFHAYSKEIGIWKVCRNLSGIQQSYQKLQPFLVVILVWREQTFSSSSSDSIPTPRKMASGNSCKNMGAIKGTEKMLSHFSRYFGLARIDLLFTEQRFHTQSKENGIRKQL